jgi:hypothetical protein
MDPNEKLIQQYYDILVMNCEKMEKYTVKLKNDPRTYIAIPVIPYKYQESDTGRFALRILDPEDYEGFYERSIDEIELLQKSEGI